MTSKKDSLWARKRTSWYRQAARTQILEEAMWLLGLFLLASIGLFIYGVTHSSTTPGQLALVGGGVCAATFLGLRTGQPWSRFVGGAVAAILACGPVFGLQGPEEASLSRWAMSLVYAIMWGMTAIFLLGPRSRQLFEQARTGAPPGDGE